MTLTDELFSIINRLDASRIDYAVCGGLAMAIHGHARATQDLDILLIEDQLEQVIDIAKGLGFTISAGWLEFGHGAVRMFRVSKVDPEHHDVIPLDLLVVTPDLEAVWAGRTQIETERGIVWTVAPSGLIHMKKISGRKQDLADIEKLEAGNGKD